MTIKSLSQITDNHRLDDAASVIAVLGAIGLPLAAGDGVLSASNAIAVSLAAGAGFSESAIDQALAAKTKLPPAERIALKLALFRHGLMRRAA